MALPIMANTFGDSPVRPSTPPSLSQPVVLPLMLREAQFISNETVTETRPEMKTLMEDEDMTSLEDGHADSRPSRAAGN
ncbi:hypothetical protein EYF80_001720 [Liparis tanakae]|uniref:Uncharacterized protein n=1 Tax=Liparis tanakae TaxID=230148 RepID=A0A4Z2JD38_9TELE|nr:hypothetical protein EYF80_001720 [Liparis tanakae]